MDNSKPISMIDVLCDPKHTQRIAITCRCTLRWIEFIPREVHDSDLICRFTCSRCATQYLLYHKQLKRLTKEDLHDLGFTEDTAASIFTDCNAKQQFDA